MTSSDHRVATRRLAAIACGLLSLALIPGLSDLSSAAGATGAPPAPPEIVTPGDPVTGLSELDTRGTVLPTLAQRSAAGGLGVVDVRWNRYGTPESLLPADGSLGAASSSNPVTAARTWLSQHASVFGLSAADMGRLAVVNNQRFAQSPARAVLFRQSFGGSAPAIGGLVTVGVAGGQIRYVSSSLARTTQAPAAATLTPLQGWVKAAANIGRPVSATDLAKISVSHSGGWTTLAVPGYADTQRVRLRALAMAGGVVRPVLQADVIDGGAALGYQVLVDAVTGKVLLRHNLVDNSSDFFPFQGEITATDCGKKHPFELTDDLTKSIVGTAAMANSADDIVLKLYAPDGSLLTSGDTGTSPESVTYTANSIPKGVYSLQVCPFKDPTVPFTPPGNYAASVTTSDQGAPDSGKAPEPRWRYFLANPSLSSWSKTATPTNSRIGCWTPTKDCTSPHGPFINIAAPGAWDIDPRTGQSTLTTSGNNAQTREAWVSPLTPGGTEQAPVSPERRYAAKFEDVWNNTRCNPDNFHPGGNDINQVVTNLFVSHNRMHDFSYYLGFTESNYNMQQDNVGRGGADRDPEVGNTQAGAATGGQPSYLGRDNANQITEADGTPGITNQYLFQPIAGAFYAPCADGALDMSIVGHEYTHAISNRMIGGPDDGITSEQGGSMGESWGDLDAGEYLFENHYSNGGNPWAVGPYATQNKKRGIRDYAINHNPLNYSDFGFDTTGVEVHADGEIWNGTMWSVRQALVKKYDARFPYTDRGLQERCSTATAHRTPLPASQCPGNRRWIQLIYDAFLLQQGATSMLDARDAMLAADTMRFGGRDLKVMWDAFAKRGMGKGAHIKNADDGQPKASFASPKARNGHVTFKTPKHPSRIYVGRYQARVTPVADTKKKTKSIDNKAAFVPGRYRIIVTSKTTGQKVVHLRIRPGQDTVVRIHSRKDLASIPAGAKLIGASDGSLNPKALFDGFEGTNWGGVNGDGTNVDERHPFVAVDLAGGVHRIKTFHVSALLHPAPASPTDVPLAKDPDPDSGSRFTALRKFAIEVCVSGCSKSSATWRRVFTSKGKAFPASLPRPVAPDLVMRTFHLKSQVRAAAVRLVALENQCTGYAGYAGEQDDDPTNATDCKSASDRGSIVHAAELQVY